MAPKVLVSDALSETAVQIFRDRGVEVDYLPDLGKDKDRLAAVIGQYDGLAIRSATKVTEKLLQNATNLKVIGRAGIGVDNVDIPAASKKGVIVMNTPFGNSVTTAEHAIALMFALTINASILILAAAAFHTVGEADVAEIDKAHLLLEPLLGSSIAPVLFGLALLCSGLNSTVTATMAGQIVMEGFIRLRLKPWLRRVITRGFAILPATVVILLYGSEGTGQLLILSQVVLSFQLPFAIVPLVMFTASRAKMGAMVSPKWLTALSALIAITIIVLNVNLLATVMMG